MILNELKKVRHALILSSRLAEKSVSVTEEMVEIAWASEYVDSLIASLSIPTEDEKTLLEFLNRIQPIEVEEMEPLNFPVISGEEKMELLLALSRLALLAKNCVKVLADLREELLAYRKSIEGLPGSTYEYSGLNHAIGVINRKIGEMKK